MRHRRNRSTKRNRAFYAMIGMGVVTGVAAVLLWPQLRAMRISSLVTVGKPRVTPSTDSERLAALLEGA